MDKRQITPTANSGVGKFLRGTTAEPTTIDLEQYRTKVSCPPVEILPDTQTLRVTTGKSEFEEGVVRYQATLATTRLVYTCPSPRDRTSTRMPPAA